MPDGKLKTVRLKDPETEKITELRVVRDGIARERIPLTGEIPSPANPPPGWLWPANSRYREKARSGPEVAMTPASRMADGGCFIGRRLWLYG